MIRAVAIGDLPTQDEVLTSKYTPCKGWWDCLESSEQVALVITAAICATALLVAMLVLRSRKRKDPPA